MSGTPSFRVSFAGTPEHEEAIGMARDQYERHFGSTIHPLGHSLNMYQDARLVGCIGFSPALESELFLEQYLDVPIEELVSVKLSQDIDRDQIVEIGTFAVEKRHHVLPLMMTMAPTLLARGYQIAVCTATGPVAGCLQKLGINSVTLAKAEANRVECPAEWGRYYSLKPLVLAGNIAEGVQAIARLNTCLAKASTSNSERGVA